MSIKYKKIGLCGAHRSGKTTLAKSLAVRLNFDFLQTSATSVFAKLGLDPKDNLNFNDRFRVQLAILNEFILLWSNCEGNYVSDRTPLDLLAYFLADLRGDSEIKPSQLNFYTDSCFDACEKYFSNLILVQPGIPLIYEPGKAAMNIGYIEHLNVIMTGLLQQSPIESSGKLIIPRSILLLDERVNLIFNKFYFDN